MTMIGTEFLEGQGLGNRLFCYISARCIALDRGQEFGTAGGQLLRADHLEPDLGQEIPAEKVPSFFHFAEAEKRIVLTDSVHDLTRGCYIAGADPRLLPGGPALPENVLLYGNLQSEAYFAGHREEIRRWLRVKPQYESAQYTADDLCILNVRGGEYADDEALFLRRRYYLDACRQMQQFYTGIRGSLSGGNALPDRLRYLVVTDDVEAARRLLPEFPVRHFSAEMDYVTLKNARYLILSNSSFGFFPAYTSETVRKVIAPKYWARHNVSDGYWASEQNIYGEFDYLGRDGRLYTAEQCRGELEEWKERAAREGVFERKPLSPEDPFVQGLRRRLERRRLLHRAARKLVRMVKPSGR